MAIDVGALGVFVEWVNTHIKGDEKGEAQIFLDHMFKAFGWDDGLKGAGAICEDRIKKSGGGTAFADLVWKPIVLIEMKRRGEDLSKHYRQAFDYWTRLVPGRPRYVVLCNFDQFWVYDFETQMDSPVDKLDISDLPERYGPLAFLFKVPQKPVFQLDHEQVTREAANLLALLFNSLIKRGVDRGLSQRFILQSLMALFAQDIGLLEKYFFTQLLDDCKTPADTYDLIGSLFHEMNSPGRTPGGRFKGVDYFNGGLFKEPARIELSNDELDLLKNAACSDWSMVRPEIFGTLFEHSMGKAERHAHGAHFTHPADIMKIVGPTIVEPWREAIEKASTLTKLQELLIRIEQFTVLDPACGSGNFLYIAYREIKRLEARIYQRMADEYKSVDAAQRAFGFVTARNFFGLDINPFAVELAKVTMMLAHKLAIDELHITEKALPLDNLDANFGIGDALIRPDGTRSPWPITDVIIGNPPFLGAKLMKPEYGAQYVETVRRAYPEVPGNADFCVYWFRRAHEALAVCTPDDPLGGRAGLVGTQNIRNNDSRVGGLDYICQDGTVIEAIDNQPWSGEANVHVSIANWVKTQDIKLLPKVRRLWFKSGQSAPKDFDLDCREVKYISSSLSGEVDVSVADVLSCNQLNGAVCQGITPGHAGFLLSDQERQAIVLADPASASVIHPYLIGDDMLSDGGTSSRYIIDFESADILSASRFKGAFKRVERTVLPDMKAHADSGKSERSSSLNQWWLHWRARRDLMAKISAIPRYLACSRVTKRPIFAFIDSTVRPGDALQVFAFEDNYSFGILQSSIHWEWFVAKSSKLKSDYRYTTESVFDTFPWPQSPTPIQVTKIADAAQEILTLRNEAQLHGQGLRKLYRTLEMPGKNPLRDAHIALDKAVLAAYGFSSKKDLLSQLLNLNQLVLSNLAHLEPVVGPGIPGSYKAKDKLISKDCLG